MFSTLAFNIGLATLGAGVAAADEWQTYPLWPKGGSDTGDEKHSGDNPTITLS
jgi:hypothetical protein